MRKLLALILYLTIIIPVYSFDSKWKIHPVFDEEVTQVVETLTYVYFTSRQMPENEWNEVFLSLFRFDKKSEELLSLSTSNFLNGNSVRDVAYNPGKGYLAVLYKDYNIDLLFNDGTVKNIPSYSKSSFGYDKTVNSMSVDQEKDRLYLATDFGYIAINDKKYEVGESRIYDVPVQSFGRLGNYYLLIKDNKIFTSPSSAPRLGIDDYDEIGKTQGKSQIYPLSDNTGVIISGEGQRKTVKKISYNGDEFIVEDLFSDKIYNAGFNSTGLAVTSGEKLYQFNKDGSYSFIERPAEFLNSAAVSDNLSEIWDGKKRKGLGSVKLAGGQWKVTRDYMLPNSPATFASVSYANHPDKGLLVLNYGYNPQTLGLNEAIPFELSSYKQGRWSNHAPSYTNPSRTEIMLLTNGMAVDPDNPSLVYISSCHNGIVRLNLDNSQDIIHMSRPNDPDAGKSGFIPLVKTSDFLPYLANFSAPYFDAKGNLWMNYADWDDQYDPNPHLYCWTREARRSTTSSSDIKLPQLVEVDIEVPVSNTAFVVPLLKSGNGCLVHVRSHYDESLILIDTNGTPTDTSDDTVYKFPEFRDSDGNSVDVHNIRFVWEDPSTGYVWVGHLNGVFYFIPSQVTGGNFEVNRIKVSRNDGTNLADYLLDGVTVNQMATDSDGRKWFATAGGGLICTSSNGREIIEEFNTSNSPLPDDVVYGLAYDKLSNSLMISTADGFAEYSLPVSSSSGSKKDVKAYPNPVRPEFSGYVTITDIPEGSLVKITDVAGNLVKDLGIMSGFEILWDISDSHFNRVKSGVYHILVSPGNQNGNYTAVGKILVIS